MFWVLKKEKLNNFTWRFYQLTRLRKKFYTSSDTEFSEEESRSSKSRSPRFIAFNKLPPSLFELRQGKKAWTTRVVLDHLPAGRQGSNNKQVKTWAPHKRNKLKLGLQIAKLEE
ncbi:MAG: hypothetical protein ABH810_03320 [bacterium]